MRLVEGVLRELLGILPYLLGDFQGVAVLDRTCIPVGLQLAHDIEFLLAHGLA